ASGVPRACLFDSIKTLGTFEAPAIETPLFHTVAGKIPSFRRKPARPAGNIVGGAGIMRIGGSTERNMASRELGMLVALAVVSVCAPALAQGTGGAAGGTGAGAGGTGSTGSTGAYGAGAYGAGSYGAPSSGSFSGPSGNIPLKRSSTSSSTDTTDSTTATTGTAGTIGTPGKATNYFVPSDPSIAPSGTTAGQ
ncbi:MAG TPA: hypothetical protein VE087_02155, partial [Xanthobacteraceae bacterium]|nr:hypothetical protein [Xanthobacteraceae bacterium]